MKIRSLCRGALFLAFGIVSAPAQDCPEWRQELRACKPTTGEGVLGIRRGFRLAGAEHVLTTLWPINDQVTVTLMREFYGDLVRGSPTASLSAAQRKWLVRLRDDPEAVELPTADGGAFPVGGLHWAVNLAGPFLLSR